MAINSNYELTIDPTLFEEELLETQVEITEDIPELSINRKPGSKSFSVIICCHNCDRYQDAIESIESALDQTVLKVEVLAIVDRNEKLFNRLSNHYASYHSVKVLLNDGDPGLSASRNVGLIHASGDIIAFLDDDAVADKEWLARLLDIYSDKSVIGCGGPIRPLWISGEAKWIPEEFYWVMGCTYKGFDDQPRRIRSNFGSNMSFRRTALVKEQFDIRSGITDGKGVGEEVELCLRLARRFPGQYIYHCPEAVVYHRIYDYRKSVKHLLNRCFQYGLCIGGCSKELNEEREEVAQEDKNMATYLVMGSIPERITGVLSNDGQDHNRTKELVQLVMAILSSITIISGLSFGRLMGFLGVVHRP